MLSNFSKDPEIDFVYAGLLRLLKLPAMAASSILLPPYVTCTAARLCTTRRKLAICSHLRCCSAHYPGSGTWRMRLVGLLLIWRLSIGGLVWLTL